MTLPSFHRGVQWAGAPQCASPNYNCATVSRIDSAALSTLYRGGWCERDSERCIRWCGRPIVVDAVTGESLGVPSRGFAFEADWRPADAFYGWRRPGEPFWNRVATSVELDELRECAARNGTALDTRVVCVAIGEGVARRRRG